LPFRDLAYRNDGPCRVQRDVFRQRYNLETVFVNSYKLVSCEKRVAYLATRFLHFVEKQLFPDLQALDDGVGEAGFFHGIQASDRYSAGSGDFVDLLFRMGAVGVSEHSGALDCLQGGLKGLFGV